MSKDQKQNKKFTVETVDKLKTACKILIEIRESSHHWKVDSIWPVNLYIQGMNSVIDILQNIIFNYDVSLGHINDK